MADDKSKRGKEDRERISLSEAWEVRYWRRKFGCTEEELRAAVATAGHMANDVAGYFAAASSSSGPNLSK